MKLIKQKVEYNSKHIPGYKEAFDHYVKNTDMSKRDSQAVRERKVKDAKNSAGKAVRGVGNILAGRMQFVGGSMLIGYTALRIGQKYGAIPSNDVLLDRANGKSVVEAAARVYVRKALVGAAAGAAINLGARIALSAYANRR